MQQFPVWQGSDGKRYTDDYFVYGVGPGTNGAAGSLVTTATGNATFNIQADADFEWCYTTWTANKNGLAVPWSDSIQVPINVLIVDGGSGRNLFNQALPITGFAGIGREPYLMPRKRLFMAKATVNVNFTNFGADTWDNIFLMFHGRKIFTVG